jgi:D-glycero-D-manno-heptose 1,7-bisphosphate phosphatase
LARLSHPGVAFLDRDGTINRKAPAGEYIIDPRELQLLPGAAEAIRRLNDAGVGAIVVTNQRGIALGRMSAPDVAAVHAELARQLAGSSGGRIDAFFFCPHDEGQCNCRKPQTGMFDQAHERFPWIEFERSAMIGDSASDVEAGRRLGMTTVRLRHDAPDLGSAVDQLLGLGSPGS